MRTEKVVNFRFLIFLSAAVVVLVSFISLFNRYTKKDIFCEACNIVIFDIDTLRADALPCYGYNRNTAPNICSFSKGGVMFERNFAQSNWTLTGITSTMTSLYTSAHKTQWAFIDSISPEITTMAELFEEEGYNTILAGKLENFYVFPLGIERGFNKTFSSEIHDWENVVNEATKEKNPFFIYFQTQRLSFPYIVEDSEEIELLEPLPKPERFPSTKEDVDSLLGDYLVENYSEIFTEEGIRQFPEIFENIGPDKKGEITELFFTLDPPSGLLRDKWKAIYNSYFDNTQKGGKPAIEYMRLLYDTNIFAVDKEMQQVLNYLDSLDNTIVIIMSQHGEEFGEHQGQFSHLSLYNRVLNTPLIIKAQDLKPRRIDTTTQNIDIFPTVLELIGASIPQQAQGRSLAPLLNGKRDKERYAVSEIGFEKASIQNYEWKLIANNHNTQEPVLELFNLINDPTEQTNLAEKNPEMIEKLSSQLMSILKESRER